MKHPIFLSGTTVPQCTGISAKTSSFYHTQRNILYPTRPTKTEEMNTQEKGFFVPIRSLFRYLTVLLSLATLAPVMGQSYGTVGDGTSSNSSSSYPAPFGNYYYGARHQFLVTAAELNAVGIGAGASISSLGFDVSSTNSASHSGWNVKVYATAVANPLSSAYVTTGLVGQSAVSNHTPVTGWNQFDLNSAFTWNGTDNLVVETCFNNTGYGTNASTRWTANLPSSATYSRYYRADAAGVCTSTSSTTTSTNTRPNIRFGYSGGTPPVYSGCTSGATYGSYSSYTPSTCNGTTQNNVGAYSASAGYYSSLSLTAGREYVFSSSISTDYLTLATNIATPVVLVHGTSSSGVSFIPSTTGTYRLYLHVGPDCSTNSTNRTRYATCSLGAPTGCTTAPSGQWPSTTYTPSCTGSAESITTNGYPAEYSLVNLTSGIAYTFSTPGQSHYVTIATNVATPVVLAHGTSPVVYTPTSNMTVRMYHHLSAACNTQQSGSFSRAVSCSAPITSCSNSSNAGTTTGPSAGGYSTGSCTASQYRTFTSIANATQYSVSSSIAGDFVTVRTGSSGPGTTVVAEGLAPLNFTTSATTNLYLHVNTNETCGTNSSTRTLTLSRAGNGAPCANTSSAGSITAPSLGNSTAVTIQANQYRTMSPAIGAQYTFTSTVATDYITVRMSSTSGTVLGHGPSPLVVVTNATSTLYISVNQDNTCATNATSRTLTVARDAIDPCSQTIATTSCGEATPVSISSGAGAWAVSSTCSGTTLGAERIFKFTSGLGGTHNLTFTSGSYNYAHFYFKPQSAGCGATGWTCIGYNNYSTNGSWNFTAAANTAYYILVDNGSSSSSVGGSFRINCPPPNDVVCDAITLTCGQTVSGSTIGATNTGTNEGTTSCGSVSQGSGRAAVWYKVLGTGEQMTASLCGTNPSWDSKINVYSAANCTSTLTCVGGNDDSGPACSGNQASYQWSSVSGTTYWIKVHGYSSEAAFSLAITCQENPCAPANILPITCGTATSATMTGSGMYDPYACSGYNPGQERFYSFTPLGSGSYSITQNSNSAGVIRYMYKTVSSGCSGTSWSCFGSITSTGTTPTVTLTGGTAYYIIVDQGTTNSGTVNFTLNCPPDNDLVCNAADISCGQTVNGSTLMGGNAGSYEYNGSSCGGVSHNYSSAGVWYKVTGNGQVMTASLCGTTPTWNSRINVFSGASCTGTLSCVGGNDDNGSSCNTTQASYSWPSTNGTVYWIKVHGNSTDAAFSLSLTCEAMPAGATCDNAIAVSSYPYTDANTLCGKFNDYSTHCYNTYSGEDVVYQLNIAQTGTYSITVTGEGNNFGWFLKTSTNCTSTSNCVTSATGTVASGTYNFTSTGTWYLIVDRSTAACLGYTLEILPPITNDNCAGAIALTTNPTIDCASTTTATTVGATQSQTACSGNGTASDDVWFTFQATAVSHVVTVTPSSLNYPAIQVFSGACSGNGASASIGCNSNTSTSLGAVSLVVTDLSIGSTYRVRVHSYYSGTSYTGGFSICVATPGPCTAGTASPTGIQTPSCTGSASSVSGSVGTGYTRVNLTGGTPYTFSSSRTADYLTITNSTGATAFVFGPGPITWTPPGGGTDEYRFYTHSDINCGTASSRTRYVSCPPPPPSNDDCAGAISITPSISCETISGTLAGATQSIPAASGCTTNGAPANDVWFKFTATANNHVVNVRGTSSTDLIFAVYHGGPTGICNGTYVSCMDQMYFTTTDTESLSVATTPGDVYFVRVYSYTGSAGTSNTFQICVTVPSPNNSCSSMQTLVVSSDAPNNSCDNNTLTGNTAGASQDGPQPTCGGNAGPWADVWYSFNSGYNSAILTTLVPSSAVMGSLVLDLFTGSCGSLTSVACYLGSDAGNPQLAVEPNTDYVLRVSTNRRNQIGGTFTICLSSPPKPSCITEAPEPAMSAVLCESGSPVVLDWPEADNPAVYALLFNSAPLGGPAPSLVTNPLPGNYLVTPTSPQVATTFDVGVLPPGQYVWRVVPRNGNGSPSPQCTAPSTTWRFTVQPIPTVTSTGTYGPVCVNGSPIALAGTGAPSGGTGAWSGPGVSSEAPWTFNPAIAGAGTHSLSFTYTANGCASETSTVSIVVNDLPVVNAGSYGPFCSTDANVDLVGSPAGGTWSGTGLTGDQFSPSAGTQTLTYTFADGNGCSNSDQVVITVNPLPTVDAGSYGPFCSTDANVDLVGSPAGGTWSGTGVTGEQFSPSAGTQTLTYTYADGNNCTNSAEVTVTVTPATTWYLDQDGDGFGDPNTSMLACAQPADHVANSSDCDDSDVQAFAGASCTTGDPCITGETLDANCNCTGGTALPDSDNDGICDSVDTCELAVDGIANFDENTCACELGYFATFTDIDGNDVITACGICPPGYFCADGIAALPCPSNTYNPSLGQTECLPCASGESSGVGAIACTPDGALSDVNLEFRTPDGSSDEISWEIVNAYDEVKCTGGPYPAGITSPIVESCSLLDGCYRLRVFDSAGDGFGTNGGYQLRLTGTDPKDLRIIDNMGNFNSGNLSAISGGPNAFCLPMSTQKPLYHHRDRLDFVSNEYLVCEPDEAVSNVWLNTAAGDPQRANSGYQFWFFDPNGDFSYRRGRYHSSSDGFGPADQYRACHMKINNWVVANQIPENVLMNVRIRTRVNGVYGDFGPAYRFVIDPVRAQCKLTKLLDYVESPFLSCNSTREFGSNNYVHARTVPGANKYQFRFRIPAENFVVVRSSNTYFLKLNWSTDPLLAGKTYVVDVRASKDGGATWCSNFIAPAVNPWGDLCNLTIVPSAQAEEQNMAIDGIANEGMSMWPNPNSSEQLWLQVEGFEADVQNVSVDIFDMTGKRIVARQLPIQDEKLNTVLDLNGQLAAGLYMVNVSAGTRTWNQRLVITR